MADESRTMDTGHVVKIVTHHTDTIGAAKAWIREGVCAVGFVYDEETAHSDAETIRQYMLDEGSNEASIPSYSSQFLRFRDEVEVGDLVFAYVTNNRVGMVGVVRSEMFYTEDNSVAAEFDYPNQRRVDWWPDLQFFERAELPNDLKRWVATTGTILRKEYNTERLRPMLSNIQSGVTIDALETEDEDEIKDFMEDNISKVQEGLSIIEREREVSGTYMDFLAENAAGGHVIVEVKQWATPHALTQLRTYMRKYEEEEQISNVSGILVALDFNRDCIEDWQELVQHGFPLQLVRAKKTFTFNEI